MGVYLRAAWDVLLDADVLYIFPTISMRTLWRTSNETLSALDIIHIVFQSQASFFEKADQEVCGIVPASSQKGKNRIMKGGLS